METPTERDQDLILEASYQQSTILLYWHQMVHEKITDINKNLIGIATLLIPIVGSVAIPHKLLRLNFSQKFTIGLILVILISSVTCGLLQFIHEALILRYFKTRNRDRAATFYDNLNKPYEVAKKKADKFRIKNNHWFYFFPYFLSLEGLLIIISLWMMFSLVFSFLNS